MAGASCRQPLQPLGAMVRRVDPPTDTENRPAAVQSFESIHDPGEIFGGRQITAGQLLQGSQARFRLSLVDRREKAAAQQLGQLRASIRSLLFPAFSKAFFRGSHTTTFVPCGLSRSYNQAAQVPSSKVTYKFPRSPWMNCRMVAAFVSMTDSISSLPAESRTATEIVAW